MLPLGSFSFFKVFCDLRFFKQRFFQRGAKIMINRQVVFLHLKGLGLRRFDRHITDLIHGADLSAGQPNGRQSHRSRHFQRGNHIFGVARCGDSHHQIMGSCKGINQLGIYQVGRAFQPMWSCSWCQNPHLAQKHPAKTSSAPFGGSRPIPSKIPSHRQNRP